MLPIYVKVLRSEVTSFTVRKDVVPYFRIPWHYHPELEITLILKGAGTRFVGDSIEPFGDGDLVLVGQNLPHFWQNDKVYYTNDPHLHTVAIVVHLLPDFAGPDFIKLPELKGIQELFSRAQQGIKFYGQTRAMITKKMKAMLKLKGMARMLELLSILHLMSYSSEYTLLSSQGFIHSFHVSDAERVNRVYTYVMNHFKQAISLEEAAAVANMSPMAFCRYFKARTRKTFARYVNEVRIGYACRLLTEGKLPIIQVCYESGFNHLSNFNLQFKNIMQTTPYAYQRKHNSLDLS
jgi:AraC-like DNA-binding protein